MQTSNNMAHLKQASMQHTVRSYDLQKSIPVLTLDKETHPSLTLASGAIKLCVYQKRK